jgi:hypothetical protein
VIQVVVVSIIHLRLKTKNITDALSLVSDWGRDLSDGVHEVNTEHPLVGSELNLTSEVVKMSDEAGEDLLGASLSLWATSVNDMLGEVWVESVGWGVGSHVCYVYGRNKRRVRRQDGVKDELDGNEERFQGG